MRRCGRALNLDVGRLIQKGLHEYQSIPATIRIAPTD
jgi:hypothetical protein